MPASVVWPPITGATALNPLGLPRGRVLPPTSRGPHHVHMCVDGLEYDPRADQCSHRRPVAYPHFHSLDPTCVPDAVRTALSETLYQLLTNAPKITHKMEFDG